MRFTATLPRAARSRNSALHDRLYARVDLNGTARAQSRNGRVLHLADVARIQPASVLFTHLRDRGQLPPDRKKLDSVRFYNVFYAQGVQDFEVKLQIFTRSEYYPLGETFGRSPDRCAVISWMRFGWLKQGCRALD